jgi:hypothetical protein
VNLFRVIVNLFRFNRTNWKAVALCFLTASVFWLFNALNKNYSTNVRFPLSFEFDQAKYVPAATLPRDIYLNVSGNGWDLFRKSLGVKLPLLMIPLERPTEVKKIVGSTMPPILAGQVGNLKINHVVTDTLYLNVEPKDSGRYKLVVDARGITFKKGYGRISPIVVLPDTVRLEGPRSAIHNLPDSLGLVLPERRLGGNFRDEIEVTVANNEFIKRNPPVVEVIFEVGPVVEVQRKIKLELLNIPAVIKSTQQTDSILCEVRIPKNREEDFRQISTVKAVVNLIGFKKGEIRMLPVVVGLPPYVELLRTDSVKIKL